MTARPDDPGLDDAAEADEEALRWAGDEELGRAGASRPARNPLDPDPARVDEQEAALEALDDELDGPEAAAAGSSSLGRRAATALFAIVYLLVTVGWVLSVQRMSSGATELFPEISWQFGEFMAMMAGPLWFGAVFQLARGRSALAAVLWWLLGVLLLVPWPFVLLLAGAVA